MSIRNYTIQQVQQWLAQHGFAKHMEVFASCEVNGELLVEMTEAELTADLGFTPAEAQRLLLAVKQSMQGTRSNTASANTTTVQNNYSIYTPSPAAMATATQQQPYSAPTANTDPSSQFGGTVPSIFAAPSNQAPAPTTTTNTNNYSASYAKPNQAYKPYTPTTLYQTAETMSNNQPQYGGTPSIFSAPPPTQTAAVTHTATNGTKPNYPATNTAYQPQNYSSSSSAQYSNPTPTTTATYSTPSLFAAPPPAPAPAKPNKPNGSATQYTKPNGTSSSQYHAQPTQSTKPNYSLTQSQQQHNYQQQQHPPGVLNAQQRQEFEQNQPEALKHADIWMISGCEDRQTSADIGNVNSFQLPDPHGRAGGACTAALLNVLYENDKTGQQFTFTDVMMKMRTMIKSKGLSQIPQLSSTHPIDMNRRFELVPNNLTGRRRAVIIGINYTGQRGALRGCHNDAFNMKKYIQARHQFQERDMTLLIDDGRHTKPTKANILSAYRKIVAESRPGDAIFLHYSGHGTKVKDLNGDEADGYDEALVPLDFKKAGQIIDDDLYKIIVEGLPRGVHVVSVMDCCHSGTILDLPYIFKANGEFSQMEIEESFKPNKLFSAFGGGAGKLLGAAVVGGILGGLLG